MAAILNRLQRGLWLETTQPNLVLQHTCPSERKVLRHLCSEGLAEFSTLLPFTEATTSTACTGPNLLPASPVTPEGYFTSFDAKSFYHMIQVTKEHWNMSQVTKKKKKKGQKMKQISLPFTSKWGQLLEGWHSLKHILWLRPHLEGCAATVMQR